MLAAHYGNDLTIDGKLYAPLINKNDLNTEWALIRQIMFGSYSTMTSGEMCTTLINQYSEDFLNIAALCTIALTIPVSSVPCERGFSYQNRVKNKLRSRLGEHQLDTLMRISCEGPNILEFDFERAVKIWEGQKLRRKVF